MEMKDLQTSQVLKKDPIGDKKGGIPGRSSTEVSDPTTSIDKENLQAKATLLEEILSKENMMKAYQAVKRNKGAGGVDGLQVSELMHYLKGNWQECKKALLEGRYIPRPVKRIEIAKPNGGTRKLGIPTVLDRLIQQAILQRIQPEVDKTFSENSYGFRPRRSAHQAVEQLRKSVEDGYEYVVDLDLEEFFDTVQHERLMTKLKERIGDQRVLSLIRRYLNAGILIEGVQVPTKKGVPQGSPLSPLLSNIILDELDKELERRGHRFVRYADDCNILVKSQRSGKRVLKSIQSFIETQLKLKVNQEKSAVGKAETRKFLGFSCQKEEGRVKLVVSQESVKRFKERIRELTKIRGGQRFKQVMKEVNTFIVGWKNYFLPAKEKTLLKRLDGWIRRRLRACAYSLMKNGKTRLAYFIKEGIGYVRAYRCAYSSKGVWHASHGDVMQQVLNNKRLKGLGLCSLS